MRFILFAFCLCAALSAKPLLTLKELGSKPKGIARDFYIWEFISDKDTSLEESLKAYDLVYREIPKLKSALQAKGYHPKIPKNIACAKLPITELVKQDEQCIAFGLKLSQVPTMPASQITTLQQKLAKSPNLLAKIKILRSSDIAQAMFAANAQVFAEIFNALTYQQKLQIFAKSPDPKAIQRLANQNASSFNRVLQHIILDSRLLAFKQAIAKADITTSDSNTFFLLGINELLNDSKQQALRYFERSRNAAIDPFFKDRAMFWQYLVSGNVAFLHDLQTSKFVDIFSIYANQKLKTKPNYEIVSSFDGLILKKPPINISDPFAWQVARDSIGSIKDMTRYEEEVNRFYTIDTTPHLAHFSNRITKYSVNYYIMPYVDLVHWRDDKQKAMSLAIAKQESHFIPALVSRSYALGMMQIMPFNLEPFAKKLGIKHKVTLEDLFKPEFAYTFGTMFLEELNDEFKHPLFVAYAYNGGPGFWRRTLAKGQLFVKNRKYEPWLSMELIANEEPRFYGMKVLANYIIYQELLGHKVDIESLLKQTLRY
ncbi:lytic transglycosylase domain-containing protein [Helicobacter zhangjianzhongii]|uniref:Lytic transglycosylase domain-containing protein n=1 Tax=Helicobacter zhangjianzhongii TaxID=2974574 RepID=A0ACC6FRC3_9HELI|nr:MULTISPECIES: lytic transglycosylase domain-containing protein [unclassified Helicobacter]MDL0079989.1 lytic transglycosylase domain-containing protein [Helicobacter sp. CPD2-1]MDL0081776.1 lytic transglycosylase domain-containing protein [Helicobacter sp. XJK30-2]